MDDLLDHVEVDLADEAEVDAGDDAKQPQRADHCVELRLPAGDSPLHRLAGGIDRHQLGPLEQLVEPGPRGGRRSAGGDQSRERLAVGAASGRQRFAMPSQLGEELVQRDVGGGGHRPIPVLHLDALRQPGDIQQRLRNHDLRARVQAARHPHPPISHFPPMHPLQHPLQPLQAGRPQHDLRLKRDQLPPVFERGRGVGIHAE